MLDTMVWAILALNGALFLLTWMMIWNHGRRWRKLKRHFPQLFLRRFAHEESSLLGEVLKDGQALKSRQEEAEQRLKYLEQALQKVPRHLGLVRYNAFPDVGGELSFSMALLDDQGDGVLLTSIYHRGEGNLYAKPVKGGTSSLPLSPEEEQAIQSAWGRKSG